MRNEVEADEQSYFKLRIENVPVDKSYVIMRTENVAVDKSCVLM